VEVLSGLINKSQNLQLDDATSQRLVKQAEAHVIIRLFGLFLLLFFLRGCSSTTSIRSGSRGSNCKLAGVLEEQQQNVTIYEQL
jgi:hypothetical protein